MCQNFGAIISDESKALLRMLQTGSEKLQAFLIVIHRHNDLCPL